MANITVCLLNAERGTLYVGWDDGKYRIATLRDDTQWDLAFGTQRPGVGLTSFPMEQPAFSYADARDWVLKLNEKDN